MAETERTPEEREARANEQPGETVIPVCAYCKHGRDDGTCIAFPDGIPIAILGGMQHHDAVQVDQTGGATFEQATDAPELPTSWTRK